MRLFILVLAALIPLQALAFDASKFASPTYNAPKVDKIIIQGTGSTGDASTLSVRVRPSGPLRSLAERAREEARIEDFAVPVAGNYTAAFQAAEASTAKVILIGEGDYTTTMPIGAFTKRYVGKGRIVSADGVLPGNLRLTKLPTTYGSSNSILTAFSGDLSNLQDVSAHIIQPDTTPKPTTGYASPPETFKSFSFVRNSGGWNQDAQFSIGRTLVGKDYIILNQDGQGDMTGLAFKGYVTSTKPGATGFLATPNVTFMTGGMEAFTPNANFNPVNWQMVDNGFDVGFGGHSLDMYRTNDTGALGANWVGFQSYSRGTKPVDVAFRAWGPFKTGFDASYMTTGAALTLRADQFIYGDVAATDPLAKFPVLQGAKFGWATASNGWEIWSGSQQALVISTGSTLVKNVLTHGAAVADASALSVVPEDGFVLSVPDYTTSRLLLKHAATLASLTISLPANALEGTLVTISARSAVTAVTLQGNGRTLYNPVATLCAGCSAKYILTQGTWDRTE